MYLRSGSHVEGDVARRMSDECGIDTGTDTPTIQSAKEECDINVIVKRFGVTGQVVAPARLPSYGDFDTVMDFQTAMNAVRAGEEAFMQLPAHVRKRFSNDPQAFLEFCADDKNLPELRKMGLAREVPLGDNTPAASGSPVKQENVDARSTQQNAPASGKASAESG